jgi:tungstate transport system substrate-binding protein
MAKFFKLIEVKAAEEENKNLKLILAATTSFRDSGLGYVLVGDMEMVSGFSIQMVAKVSGAAIDMLRNGQAQVAVTHSPELEEMLVKDGWVRVPFMQNHFYLVGPQGDPANVKGMTLSKAFKIIHDKKLPFVSRDDNSGTDLKEKSLWRSLGLDPSTFASWYIKTQAGMLDSLMAANEKGAYILTDESTWMSNKSRLANLDTITTSEEGLNVYSFLYKDDHYRVLADYLKTPEAQALIRQYHFEPIP